MYGTLCPLNWRKKIVSLFINWFVPEHVRVNTKMLFYGWNKLVLSTKVVLSKSPRLPLKAYDDLSTFKLYALDIGLLRQLSELDASVLLLSTPGYTEYKGALAENYVLQSLTAQFQASFRYWTSGNKAEVDFLLQHGNHIYPVEVKADQNITGKSLIQYEKLYQPACRIRYSMLNLKQDGNLINIPLFLADKTKELLNNNVG